MSLSMERRTALRLPLRPRALCTKIVFAGEPKKRLLPRPAGEVATPDLIRGSRRGQERPLVPRYAESLLIPRAFHRARAPPPPSCPWPPSPAPGGGRHSTGVREGTPI